MKQIFLATFLCSSVVSAQNMTVVPKPALFMTRVSVNPSKAATLGAFQVLFAGVAFVPAAFVALAVKRHAGEASVELIFATVAGTILAASAGVTLAQALSNFADATASAIWNPDEVVVVKTPIAVLN